MGLLTILSAATVCAFVVAPVFAQLPGRRSCQTSPDGAVTIKFEPGHMPGKAPVTGAPYSAVGSSESVQTLANGTHLTRGGHEETATWRDSEGRVRTESRAAAGEPARPCDSALVKIEDPVAGYVYLLDQPDKFAYRLQLAALTESVMEPAAVLKPLPNGPGTTFGTTTESLGEKTMFGVRVTGSRGTTNYPKGSPLGNDQPITASQENWISPKLQISVYSQATAPDGTVTTLTRKELSVAEPDPSLLRVPPEYRIIDETGPFTVNIPTR